MVDFYRLIEAPEQAAETVKMDIPAEYQDAVQDLLRKLMLEKTAGFSAPKSQSPHITASSIVSGNNNVSHHPDLDHLIIVYRNQTGDERGKGLTKNKNGKGFNKHDAPILTTIAENYLEYGFVFQDDLATVSHLIQKYHAQWGE